MSAKLSRWPDIMILTALLLLVVVFWGDCLWGGKVPVAGVYQQQMKPWSAQAAAAAEPARQWDSLLWDSVAQFYPWRLLLHNAARTGELPLWNPYQFSGYPFVGNGQSALFYPPNWLYLVLHPAVGMGLSAALHYFLGAFFVFGLARTLGLRRLSALFGAVAFTFGGFVVTWIELPTLVNSLIWLPLAWWGIEVLRQGQPARGVGMLASALGLTLLAGHLQIAAYVWLFSGLYAVAALMVRRRRPFRLGWLVAAFVLGGALSLVQVLPTLELGSRSPRGGGGPSAAGFAFHQQRALQPVELLTLLQADFLGSPVQGNYPGISYSEHCGFVGATTLLLGLAGLWLGRRRRHFWLFAGIAVFALWGAMAGPPAWLLYWGVPKLGQAGGFSRLLSVWTLAAALCGAMGLEAVLRGLEGRAMNRCQAVACTPPVVDGLGSETPKQGGRTAGGVKAPALQTAGARATPAATAEGNGGPAGSRPLRKATATGAVKATAGLALTLLALELLPWAYRFNPRCEASRVYPETRITRMLCELSGGHGRYMAATPRRSWRLDDVPAEAVLPPNAGTVYGVRCVDGYDSLYPTSCRTTVGATEGADPSPLANGNMLLLENTRAWRGKADLVVAAEGQTEGWGKALLRAEGCEVFADSAGGTRRLRVSVNGKVHPAAGAGFSGDHYNWLRVQVQTPAEGLLHVGDTWYPGWLAFVDGKPRGGLLSAEGGRTLPVRPGDRAVSMVYYPSRVVLGEFVSLCALAVLLALGVAFGKAGRGR